MEMEAYLKLVKNREEFVLSSYYYEAKNQQDVRRSNGWKYVPTNLGCPAGAFALYTL